MADGDDAARKSFDLIDSAVFAGMLGISAIVGVYYAYKSRKNADAVREYLVGGQNMSIFPISMSLIASYISGISILGLPAEMYVFGTQFWCGVISDSFVSLTMAFVYLPVFYGLGITSSYEYLKLRFNDAVRLMGCVIFLIKMLLYIPLVIYVPALAFNQVSGINLHAVALLVCVVCIFYTTLGGLKAVVWTDAIQTIVMFGGVIIVAVYGTHRVGGFDVVWQRNRDTDRIEFFNMDLDPTTRHTFWSVVVGNYLNWLASCSVNQAMVQRCLAMPNLKMANATITIMAIGIIIIVSLCCYTGLVVFAAFHDCDPVKTKQIGKSDQLLPFYVMELSTSIPGLPGLFVACVFSAALSTMSTGLNSMSGVIFEDMIKPWLRGPISDTAASRTMKATVIVIGIVCMALVFLVEKLGGLIQAGKSLSSITAGPLLGMFTLGMFFPSANSAGAMVGGLVGLALVAWISLGTQAAVSTGEIVFPAKPVSIEGCPESIKNRVGNLTTIADIVSREQPFLLYRMSYLWYTWVGFLIAISIGLLVSWITGSNRCKPGDEKLYTPAVRRFLRSKVDASTQRIRAFDKVSMELGKVEMDGVEEPVRNPAVFRDTRNPP
ncbi:sodium-coupled monocarboxylate transporter 2 isoform X1 [Augochlora pura]